MAEHYTPNSSRVMIVNRALEGVPEGTRVEIGTRPEYGDSVRVIAWRRPSRRGTVYTWTRLASVRFVPRAALCSVDCGHVVPGMALECGPESH